MPRHASRRKASSEMNAIPARQSFDGPALQIALVNNMPIRRSTRPRRNLSTCCAPAPGNFRSLALLYIVQRAARGNGPPRLRAKSRGIEALYAPGADALIVTGSEPRADRRARKRALLGRFRATGRLGARSHDLRAMVLPRRAWRGATVHWRDETPREGKNLRRLRLRGRRERLGDAWRRRLDPGSAFAL